MSRLNEGLSIDQLGGGTEEMTEKLELFRLEADGMTDISFGLMMDEMGSQMITNQIQQWKIALGDMMGTATEGAVRYGQAFMYAHQTISTVATQLKGLTVEQIKNTALATKQLVVDKARVATTWLLTPAFASAGATGAMAGAATSLAFLPILKMPITIMAIIGAMYLLYKHCEPVRQVLDQVWEVVKQIGLVVFEFGKVIVNYMTIPLQIVWGTVKKIWSSITGAKSETNSLADAFKKFAEIVNDALAFLQKINNVISSAIAMITGASKETVEIEVKPMINENTYKEYLSEIKNNNENIQRLQKLHDEATSLREKNRFKEQIENLKKHNDAMLVETRKFKAQRDDENERASAELQERNQRQIIDFGNRLMTMEENERLAWLDSVKKKELELYNKFQKTRNADDLAAYKAMVQERDNLEKAFIERNFRTSLPEEKQKKQRAKTLSDFKDDLDRQLKVLVDYNRSVELLTMNRYEAEKAQQQWRFQDEISAMQKQIEKLNEQRKRASIQGQKNINAAIEALNQSIAIRQELQITEQAKQKASLELQLQEDNLIFIADLEEREFQRKLIELDKQYHEQREKHKNNAEMLLAIDAEFARKGAEIVDTHNNASLQKQIENARKLQLARINSIQDLAKRELELNKINAQFELEDNLKMLEEEMQAQLELARKYGQDEAEIIKVYANFKLATQQDYYRKVNKLLIENTKIQMSEQEKLIRNYTASFQNAFFQIDGVFDRNIQHNRGVDAELANIEKAKKEVFASYIERKITIEEYYNQIGKLRDDYYQKESEKISVFKNAFSATLGLAFADMNKVAVQNLSETLAQLADLEQEQNSQKELAQQIGLDLTRENLRQELELHREANAQKLALLDEYEATQAKINEKQNAKMIANMSSVATAMGASYAQLKQQGVDTERALAASALAGLKAKIPVYAAQIIAKAFAINPFLGIGSIAALPILYSMLAAAEKSVAGFYTGVVNIGGKRGYGRDNHHIRVDDGESVLTAKATYADGNMDMFEWMNKTGNSFLDYVTQPEISKLGTDESTSSILIFSTLKYLSLIIILNIIE